MFALRQGARIALSYLEEYETLAICSAQPKQIARNMAVVRRFLFEAGVAVAGLLVWRGAVQGVKWAWALVPLVILFNPIAPIHLSRDTWQVLDVIGTVMMVVVVAGLELLMAIKKRP